MATKNKYIPLIVGVAIAAGVVIGGKLNFTDTSDNLFTTNSKKDKLNRLIDYIDYEYVDDVNTDSIVDVTVNGILDNLDPHSTYIPKEDLERITENMKGDFVGIGINYYPYKDTIAVIKPTEDGPSESAGIMSGDRILLADGDTIYGRNITNEYISKKLKGDKNTKVKLTVYRKSEDEILEFEVKRKSIPIKSVDAAYMLTDELGYIKMNRFAETSFKEFKTALEDLQDQGATKLALDLRDNPGGFLGIAEQIADEFLEDDKLILFTRDKKGREERTYATRRGDFEDGEIYILINENSASASEVIAGALQDNDKGIIVGRRSYGKGLVQREMALGDGSAVRLTVSRYYTPTGRSIQRPYTNGDNNAYYNDYYKRLRTGELADEDNIEVDDSLKFTTPKGKVVYGGGGIIPDVFVPVDRSFDNETINYLRRRGHFGYFVFEELDKDRSIYQDVTKYDFINNFEVSDDIVVRFQDYVNQKEGTNITFVAYNDEIRRLIKATLARQLFDDNSFEEVLNKEDIMVQEVILLSNEYPSFKQ
ncbi:MULTISPECIES: S41 family peptidase [Winogradskyella]|uniref:S41 family peptidase n=1 Tax=Winogradskyella TaxID=286104 RepID=UPI000C4B2E08|nr:S41 family peptidase [Winogradskyella sp. MH6]MAB48467.1 peptidase S41 [Flavobacteriaceae bacterium]MBD10955.1 peptidase S41 [Flavobacteriaceae bacterium]|tara:strand:+ start:41686 stop:43293 length:1608 start_codon:yes stop_codon:yes gene_type:complete